MPIPPQQLQLQRFGSGLGDFVLYGKYVIHLPIVCLRPELKTIVGLDQLCRDADMVALAAHTPLEDIRHAKLVPYVAQVFILTPELKGGGTSDDL